ncbi:chromosomal replication initiator protein DnaA [Conexibacter sp. SYSU D00693]|uniref:chromosomal replication initiator protein DnaA n=1 Tax=Conexibacter sp. SYSU D00693 TaxID=2812560 RepID=UPI00196A99E9|nr:chromosomal replication initiator protein DnaA [Conexibacter sp. SYSU D00693]
MQAELRRLVGDRQFDVWLAPLQPGPPTDDGTLLLLAPEDVRSWVATRLAGALDRAAAAVLGPDVKVAVQALDARGATPGATARHGTAGAGRRGARAAAQPPAEPPRTPDTRLNPRWTFEQFVIGEANRFAHAAALAVAELPGQAYNPLFLHGPPGVGKTHLLHAIGNYVKAYGGGLTVRCTTVEAFTNDFVASIQRGDMAAFKDRYRRADVLLVDDVQFLAEKVRTEEELFHTINALLEVGSQLVLTADRLPHDLERVEERLRERFAAGLVTDMRPPDAVTRLAVLRKRAHHDGVEVGEGVLELLAERIAGNVRALEGALIRVVAFASLQDCDIDLALAERVLEGLYGPDHRPGTSAGAAGAVGSAPTITVERIQELTCEAFGLTRDELLSTSRAARVAWPRQVAMFLAREHTAESLPRIGRSFGGRDHTTVLHACRRTAERLAKDPEAHDAVRALTEELLRHGADRAG